MSAIQLNATVFEVPASRAGLPVRAGSQPFPVIATALRAYADILSNRGVVLRLFGGWTVALSLLAFAGLLALGLMIQSGAVQMLTQPGAAAAMPFALIVGLIVSSVSACLATCSIIVGWFRFLLAGERPSTIYLAAGAQVWRYMWATFVLFLLICVAVVPMAFAMLPLVTMSGSGNLGQLGNALMSLVATIAGARLMVAMPAVALGKPRALWGSLAKTRGNTGRIALATIIAIMPWQIVVQLWSVTAPPGTTVTMTPAVIALIAAGAIAWCLAILASASVAAAAYRHFVEPASSGSTQA